jgi:hypothetical protein
MNRMTLLIGKVKAEFWMQRILKEHEQKFQPLLGGGNVSPAPQQQQEAAPSPVPTGQPVNQPVDQQQPIVP